MTGTEPASASGWKPGFRHHVQRTVTGWRCLDCGQNFGDRWPSDNEACPGPPADCLLRDCVFTDAGSCTVHGESCPDCPCGTPLHWEPSQNRAMDAAELARRSPYTVDEWQHALNALGDRAEWLLPTVEGVAARQGVQPLAAAQMVLDAMPDA